MTQTIESQLLGDKLRKAALQDLVIGIIFRSTSGAVFHGGTCVWRCYNGRRFSKDIDIYIAKESSIKKILSRLIQEGLDVRKDAQMRSTIFYTIKNSTDIYLQINKKSMKGAVIPYVLADGTLMNTYSLTAEAIILEKILAYNDRRLERDIYDIMVLLNSVVKKESVRRELMAFLLQVKPPKDPGALKDLVYEGVVPNFSEIVEYIKRWCSL